MSRQWRHCEQAAFMVIGRPAIVPSAPRPRASIVKSSDVDILIVPDLGDAPPDHWQSRWARNLKTARRIEQVDWRTPRRQEWADAIVTRAQRQRRPTVIVAHGLGVLAVVHAAERLGATAVVGAFLVAPLDFAALQTGSAPRAEIAALSDFWPLPVEPMPWPALVVAGSDDPMCSVSSARALAEGLGASFTEAGNVGHIDIASGHGPWPEGLLRFGQFLRELD